MRRRRPAHELRIAVDCMPLATRQAMIDGIESSRIIVGAYVDREGGVCPMLAAHRNGGRTSLASFARSWDRYTKANGKPRPATERELRTLTAMLEASIALEEYGPDLLTEAIAAHRATRNGHRNGRNGHRNGRNGHRNGHRDGHPRDTGERDRTRELRGRPGWAWLRPLRRLDEYEVAMLELEELERTRREREGERELV